MIATYIVNSIKNNAEINNIIQNKIHPLNGIQGNSLPLITYKLGLNSTATSKQGKNYLDVNTMALTIFSESYSELTFLINKVRKLFENKSYQKITDIEFTGFTDEFDGGTDVYNATLNFSLYIKY